LVKFSALSTELDTTAVLKSDLKPMLFSHISISSKQVGFFMDDSSVYYMNITYCSVMDTTARLIIWARFVGTLHSEFIIFLKAK